MTSETIAEIVAEMRELAADIAAGNAVVGQTVWRNYADRIEAAAKREREIADAKIADLQSRVKLWTDRSAELVKKCNEHYANAHKSERGNAAAMREAAKEFVAVMLDKKTGIHNLHRLAEKCRDALAAPPRNCDRFGFYEQAKSEWWKTEVLPRVDGVVRGAEKPFDEWLYSPATEKEGGAK